MNVEWRGIQRCLPSFPTRDPILSSREETESVICSHSNFPSQWSKLMVDMVFGSSLISLEIELSIPQGCGMPRRKYGNMLPRTTSSTDLPHLLPHQLPHPQHLPFHLVQRCPPQSPLLPAEASIPIIAQPPLPPLPVFPPPTSASQSAFFRRLSSKLSARAEVLFSR